MAGSEQLAQATALDLRLVVPIIAAALAFLIWIVKETYQTIAEARASKKQQVNLVRSLFAEIDFNTYDMEIFLRRSPDEDQLRTRMAANPSLVPHITDARHTEIYRHRVGELHSVKDTTLAGMVHFYGMLEKIKVQVDAVNYPSYQSLSVEGRLNAVLVIKRTADTASRLGLGLMEEMQADYLDLKLARFERDVLGTSEAEPTAITPPPPSIQSSR